MEAILVEKEQIAGKLEFPKHDVLSESNARLERETALQRATKLGNNYKGKIRLIFSTLSGDHVVETTVWASTEKNVQLKGGVLIPIHAIKEVVL